MSEMMTLLNNLRRPSLLMRAARYGVHEYNRNRDLKRLMGTSKAPSPTRAITTLIEEEAKIEDVRKAGDASYSVSKHVEILIALMAEARLMLRGPQAI